MRSTRLSKDRKSKKGHNTQMSDIVNRQRCRYSGSDGWGKYNRGSCRQQDPRCSMPLSTKINPTRYSFLILLLTNPLLSAFSEVLCGLSHIDINRTKRDRTLI